MRSNGPHKHRVERRCEGAGTNMCHGGEVTRVKRVGVTAVQGKARGDTLSIAQYATITINKGKMRKDIPGQ